MPTLEYVVVAAVGRYTNKEGRGRNVYRQVGEMYLHSDGRRYLSIDPFFNFGACERKPGSDKVFLSLRQPDDQGDDR